MPSINQATVCGHLGKDAELKFTSGGSAVINCTVATSRKWKDAAGEWKEQTDWHNVVFWPRGEGFAERLAPMLTKGVGVLVTGRIQTRSYDAKDGTKKYVTEIVAETLWPLGRLPEDENRGSAPRGATQRVTSPRQANPQPTNYPDMTDDEMPF